MLFIFIFLSSCAILKNSNAQKQIDKIETLLTQLGGEPTADVLEEMKALEFGEPESIEQTDEGKERYAFQRKYLEKTIARSR